MLLADEDEWRGHVGSLTLTLRPGTGRLSGEGPFGPAARQAAEIAVTAVLGPALARWDATWRLSLPDALPAHVVDGDSLGLPVAVAACAAWRGLPVPTGLGFTGRVDPSGRIGPVGGIRLKAAAAAAAGRTRLIVAPGCEAADDLPRVEVDTLGELWPLLWPAPRRLPWGRTGLILALGPLLALSGLSEGADGALSQALLGVVSGRLPARETAIVALPEDEWGPDGVPKGFRERRSRLPEVVDDLVAAGARSISLDLALNRPDPADPALALALRRAAKAGVPVVLALRWVDGRGPLWPASAELRALLTEGVVRVAHAIGESEEGRALEPRLILLRERAEGWIWHAAVETVASWSPGTAPPVLEGEMLRVGLIHAHAPLGRLSLRPVQRSPCWLAEQAGWTSNTSPGCDAAQDLRELAGLRGRAVWIGVRTQEDAFTLLGAPVAGIDVQAAATEVLASGRATQAADFRWNALAAGLTGAGLSLARLGVRPGPLPVLALAALPLLALAGLASLGRLVAPLPVGLAAVVGLWLGGLWTSRLDRSV